MPRNRSEKQPYECPDVDSDFYALLRIYAQAHVEEGTLSVNVRDEAVAWGHRGASVWQLFRPWNHDKKDTWYAWPEPAKVNYVADYMEFLYATQS